MIQSDLGKRDTQHIWHPYTQHQISPEPIGISHGEGSWLFLEDGTKVLDMVSSWWVTAHGHAHPHIVKAIADQAARIEQVIFTRFTHEPAVRLAERLARILPGDIHRSFFSDDGSTAIEVALKMAWQYWVNIGEKRDTILALEHAYHGDTFGAMAVSGRSIFTKAFGSLLFDVHFLPSPGECDQATFLESLETAIKTKKVASLIVEPLIQGAGGMRMYDTETLDRMVKTCQDHGIPVIFDEVMTGFGRTGTLFAGDQLQYKPDIICLSKALTGGFLPMSITATTDKIWQAFLSEDHSRTLFHGHSFTGNPIACAAANASLDLFEKEQTLQDIERISVKMKTIEAELAPVKGVKNIRSKGIILAFEMETENADGYDNMIGKKVAEGCLENGVLIRPLGNTVYMFPPYCTSDEELDLAARTLKKVLIELQ